MIAIIFILARVKVITWQCVIFTPHRIFHMYNVIRALAIHFGCRRLGTAQGGDNKKHAANKDPYRRIGRSIIAIAIYKWL